MIKDYLQGKLKKGSVEKARNVFKVTQINYNS